MCLRRAQLCLVISVARDDSVGVTRLRHLKMLTEKRNDKKITITLLIVGGGLTAYRFWWKINAIIFIHDRWCQSVVNALVLTSTNFIFSRLTGHGKKERKRHDLEEERLQRARVKWNEEESKRHVINKKLRKKMRQRHTSTM